MRLTKILRRLIYHIFVKSEAQIKRARSRLNLIKIMCYSIIGLRFIT